MTRLQKKCLFAAAGAHLLVIVVLLCSGFVTSRQQPRDDTPVLTLVNLTDDATTGSKSDPTPPPPPTPPLPPVTQPVVEQPPTPPTPVPDPPKLVEPVKEVEPVKPPDEIKPVEKPDISVAKPKPKPKPKPKVDMSVVKVNPKAMADHAAADAAAAAAAQARADAQQRERRLKAINSVMRSIKDNSSSSTSVEMPGSSSVSFANYAAVVKSKYEGAWMEPDDADNDQAITKVSVTISSDGRVTASRIVNPSGDSKVDRSVQRTLDRVDFVAPFPEGAKEKERTFIINFNLKAKRLNG